MDRVCLRRLAGSCDIDQFAGIDALDVEIAITERNEVPFLVSSTVVGPDDELGAIGLAAAVHVEVLAGLLAYNVDCVVGNSNFESRRMGFNSTQKDGLLPPKLIVSSTRFFGVLDNSGSIINAGSIDIKDLT